MFKIHATGDWRRGAVRTRWTASSRAIIPEVEEAIERAWAEAHARRPVIRLFDGAMCRLESLCAHDARLELALSSTSYKQFFGTNMSNPHLADRYGADVLANPVGLSAALVTEDGFLVLGRRNASVAYYPNRIHPFAGALEAGADDMTDVFEDMLRELDEELSLPRDAIADLRCIGLVEDVVLRQPELIFTTRTMRTREQVESKLDRAEHAGAWSIRADKDSIARAVSEPREFTPIAIATMRLLRRDAKRVTGSEDP